MDQSLRKEATNSFIKAVIILPAFDELYGTPTYVMSLVHTML